MIEILTFFVAVIATSIWGCWIAASEKRERDAILERAIEDFDTYRIWTRDELRQVPATKRSRRDE